MVAASLTAPLRAGPQVRIHTDKDTGRPKGYAHVHFEDAESAQAAVAAYDQSELHGRPIKVMFAQPK